MRKNGILNADLAYRIAKLGHMDTVVVADCGLPIPKDTPVIDLALVFGIPRFKDTVEALLHEIVVETATIADQAPDEVAAVCAGIPTTRISHDELKSQLASASVVIRTGETTPYANVIFRCGVPF